MKLASDRLKREIEEAIDGELERLKSDYGIHSAKKIVDELSAAVFSGGKRMRPLLCCWGFEAAGGQSAGSIVRAAASLELLHTFAILHDDIMDAPMSRRRRPPVHEKVALERTDLVGPGTGRYGVSVAMLAGDLALIASDRMFVESCFEPERLAAAWVEVSRMRLDAIAGQYLDLSLSGREFSSADAACIARLKSGSYSVRGPLVVGASLAGGGDAARGALAAFGESLGEAFQLADDLAGMFGDPALTGKDADSDLLQGKPTLLIALALENSSEESGEVIRPAWGKPGATPAEQTAAREIILTCGAHAKTAGRIRDLAARARAAIDDPLSSGLLPEPCERLRQLAKDIETEAGTAL